MPAPAGRRYDPEVAVTDHDRDYMRRLGEFQAAGHAAATAAHLAKSVAERLAASVALMQRSLSSNRSRHDDPTPLYDRARRLGLYRP